MKYIGLFLFIFLIQSVIAQSIVAKDGKYGLINSEATFILKMEYDTIYQLYLYNTVKTVVYAYRKENKLGLYNAQNTNNSGLIFDEIIKDHNHGAYLLRTGELFGFLIEPEPYTFDWILPKYDEVRIKNSSINEFIPDSYNYTHNNKGFSVRKDGLWGYASYVSDSMIVNLNYSMPVSQLFSERYFFRTYDSQTGVGRIINSKNQCNFEVTDVRFLKKHQDFFMQTYFIEKEQHCVIYDLANCLKIVDIKIVDFEDFPDLDFIGLHYLKINGVVKKDKKHEPDQTLSIFYDMASGKEVFRFKGMYCQKIKFDYPLDGDISNSEVRINKHCGLYPVLYGEISDDKFYPDKKWRRVLKSHK